MQYFRSMRGDTGLILFKTWRAMQCQRIFWVANAWEQSTWKTYQALQYAARNVVYIAL